MPQPTDTEKRNFIIQVLFGGTEDTADADASEVGRNTVSQLSGEALNTAYKHALKKVEEPKKRYKKGGVTPKKPKFMKGGFYKGKSHMYAAGGLVKELKM